MDRRAEFQTGRGHSGTHALDVVESILLRTEQVAIDAGIRQVRQSAAIGFDLDKSIGRVGHRLPPSGLSASLRQKLHHVRVLAILALVQNGQARHVDRAALRYLGVSLPDGGQLLHKLLAGAEELVRALADLHVDEVAPAEASLHAAHVPEHRGHRAVGGGRLGLLAIAVAIVIAVAIPPPIKVRIGPYPKI